MLNFFEIDFYFSDVFVYDLVNWMILFQYLIEQGYFLYLFTFCRLIVIVQEFINVVLICCEELKGF